MKCRECEFASVHKYPRNGNGNSAHVGHFGQEASFCNHPQCPPPGPATVLREDGPAILPVEEEREEIDMGKITITEKQEAIIRRLNDPLYTVEFLKEWVNRNDNVFINAPAALQAMGASGFFAAVRAIERAKESDGENT